MNRFIICIMLFMFAGCAEYKERHNQFVESKILKPWPWSSDLRPSNVRVAVNEYGAEK